jgi:hypothetical protein
MAYPYARRSPTCLIAASVSMEMIWAVELVCESFNALIFRGF